MAENVNERFLAVIHKLIRELSVVDRNEKLCYGLTVSQYRIIEMLQKKGSAAMSELSRDFGLAISTMTRIMDILFRDGIITRHKDTRDRRKVLVGLTDKGHELARKLQECSHTYLLSIFQNVPENKREQAVESLNLLSNSISLSFERCCKK